MTMQLILNTDSTVNIKTKMSLNEENLEICVTTVPPDVINGDVVKENKNIGFNIKDDKLEQIKEILQNKTDGELNKEVNNTCGNNVDMEISHTNEKHSDTIDELIERPRPAHRDDHQIESSTCNETDLNGLKQTNMNSENACLDITAGQKHIDDKAKIAFTNDNSASSCSADAGESIPVERTGLENIEKENNIKNIYNTIDVEKSENSPIEKCHAEPENNKVELNDNSYCKKAVDSCETINSENLNIEEPMSTKTLLNGNDINTVAEDHSDTTITETETKETEIKAFDDTVNCSMDKARSNDIDKDAIVTKEINNVISNIIENKIILNEKDTTRKSINDNEIIINEVDSTGNDTVAENKLKSEGHCSKANNVKVNEENVCEQVTNKIENHTDTSEMKSTLDENKMEIAEEITKDTNLVNLEDRIEEINRSMGDKKEIEKVNINDDEPAESALIKTIEPVIEKEEEIMNVTPDRSDDIIFNLDDDDKDQSCNAVEVKETESTEIEVADNKPASADKEATSNSNKVDMSGPKSSDEVIDLDDTAAKHTDSKTSSEKIKEPSQLTEETKTPVLKLSNTLDILSDEEEDSKDTNLDNKTINIEDDDDVMLIDEELSSTERKTDLVEESKNETQVESKPDSSTEKIEVGVEIERNEKAVPEPLPEPVSDKEALVPDEEVVGLTSAPEISEKVEETKTEIEMKKPLMHENFLKTCKKSLADMTREELEEFCIVKIVESILDRSNLGEIRTKLKTMTQSIEEYKKKALMLTKQNRDLQVVLKSIQEDQKKGTESIVPLKITRSVGMQVLMSDKPVQRRKANPPAATPANRPIRHPVPQSPRPQKPAAPQIPVPRLVPANNPSLKSPNTPQANTGKTPSPVPNGVRNPSPVQKGEKRTHNRIQSVTVDLTDDEPPSKVASRGQPAPVPPVRLVPSQNLLAPPRPTTVNSPRKVYIPISGPQGQNVRPGQTIMLKTVATPPGGPRQRCPPPHMVRMPQSMRVTRPQGVRHPAPLPDCMKQYQPPNWKALPPAPDLKLAKVENGIVISWKIEGYQEDSYEEIASYQLYAYQETSSPPSTALWKKIGDVKALPLPMACTLTQFMAGYKYYFAVRAVDIRSRLGPFSLPGSILLLNKM